MVGLGPDLRRKHAANGQDSWNWIRWRRADEAAVEIHNRKEFAVQRVRRKSRFAHSSAALILFCLLGAAPFASKGAGFEFVFAPRRTC